MVENGRVASPVGSLPAWTITAARCRPLAVGFGPVEVECIGDAEGAGGEHASDEAMMEWRLGACGGLVSAMARLWRWTMRPTRTEAMMVA
jgi:hypothetical protein